MITKVEEEKPSISRALTIELSVFLAVSLDEFTAYNQPNISWMTIIDRDPLVSYQTRYDR